MKLQIKVNKQSKKILDAYFNTFGVISVAYREIRGLKALRLTMWLTFIQKLTVLASTPWTPCMISVKSFNGVDSSTQTPLADDSASPPSLLPSERMNGTMWVENELSMSLVCILGNERS